MPFTQQLLLKVPSLLLGIIIIGGALLLSVAGLFLVRSLIPHHKLKLHNDVSGPIFGALGTIYAVLLAFMVVIVWESFDKSNLNVQREAYCLADLYRDAEAFSPVFSAQARGLFSEYKRAVVGEEWKMLARGKASPQVEKIVKRMWSLYSGYLPKNQTEQAFFEESVRKLNLLGELRTARVMDARTGVHPLLWFVLLAGGLATIIFTFFFGAENTKVQIIMTALLSTLISLILFTIILLDFPFTGDIAITPDAFSEITLN